MTAPLIDDRPDWNAFLRRWLGLSLILHLLAAFLSYGYHDVDEQFQVLEYVSARIQGSPTSDLAWEFGQRMRAWFQPLFYESVARAMSLIGMRDPFQWATAMRLVSALIGWSSVVALVRGCAEWFADPYWRRWAVRLTCLFWLIPYLHARTSSENLSGSLFVLGLMAFVLKGRAAISATLMALSFLSRYQMAFSIAAFGFWLVIVRRASWRSVATFSAAFLLTCGFGAVLDRIGYGEWSFTPWNYFHQNLVVGRAAAFGVSPMNYYLWNLRTALEPLGAILLYGTILGWLLAPTHVLSLTSFAFFAGHSLIGHKEQRFLYPIAAQAPIVWTLGIARFSQWLPPIRSKPLRALGAAVIGILLAYDVGTLLVLTLKPATAQIGFYQVVYRHEPPIREFYFRGLNPYVPAGDRLYYYRQPFLEDRPVKSYEEVKRALRKDQDLWLFHENYDLTGEAAILEPYCKLEYTTFPSWLKHLTFLSGPRNHANRWSLFRCRL